MKQDSKLFWHLAKCVIWAFCIRDTCHRVDHICTFILLPSISCYQVLLFLAISLTCISFSFTITTILIRPDLVSPVTHNSTRTLCLLLPFSCHFRQSQSLILRILFRTQLKPTALMTSLSFCCCELCISGELRPFDFMDY